MSEHFKSGIIDLLQKNQVLALTLALALVWPTF